MNASAQLTLVCWRHSISYLLNRQKALMEDGNTFQLNSLIKERGSRHHAMNHHQADQISSSNVNSHEENSLIFFLKKTHFQRSWFTLCCAQLLTGGTSPLIDSLSLDSPHFCRRLSITHEFRLLVEVERKVSAHKTTSKLLEVK